MSERDLKVYSRANLRDVLADRLERASLESQRLTHDSDQRKRPLRFLNEDRQNLLKAADRELVSGETPANSIFISYSGVGRDLGEVAKMIANEFGLHVKTGFDAEVEVRVEGEDDKEESLPHAIMNHIVSCHCFLGIWTEDFDATNRAGYDMRNNLVESQRGNIPSVWMPFELGIAASHGLAFRLLVAEGTHRLYYEKPFQFQTQVIFKRHEFEKRARRVIEYLAKKLNAKRRRQGPHW